MQIQEIILHLSLIEKIQPRVLLSVIEQLGEYRLVEVYDFAVSDFVNFGVPQKMAELLIVGLQDRILLQKELDLMREHHVGLVTILCSAYPKILKEIHVPPVLLYYQGDVTLFAHEKNIACVGSRKAHRYVHDVLTHVIVPMIEHGWVVVSGGALGADTFAHQLALDNKGKTIVVVGSGLCNQYPPQNKKLFEQVVASGGLIVSTFPMNTMPDPWNFPQRNRLISGLSKGCLVLQAAQKSGALITAQCALDQGREVFAVPGSIFDPLSAGCHDLIAQGAKLVTSSQDILVEFGYESMSDAGDDKKQQSVFEQIPVDDLSLQILQCAMVPITADLIISKLKLDMDILQNKLFELSLEGRIAQDAMGFWKRL